MNGNGLNGLNGTHSNDYRDNSSNSRYFIPLALPSFHFNWNLQWNSSRFGRWRFPRCPLGWPRTRLGRSSLRIQSLWSTVVQAEIRNGPPEASRRPMDWGHESSRRPRMRWGQICPFLVQTCPFSVQICPLFLKPRHVEIRQVWKLCAHPLKH